MPSLRQVNEDIPAVEGLRLLERVDQVEPVGRGEVWSARITGGLAGESGGPLPGDLRGVGECRVRLLRMPVDETLRARARTLARDLVALDDPGLVPVRAALRAYDGVALVYGHLPSSATGLHVLARQRMLRAGEIVTLGVGLCWALAHAHAAGITHGRICDADVLIGGDGRPVLTGVGVLGVLGAPADPEADVRALGRMLASLLDRETAGASAVTRVLGEGGASAAGLAAGLAAAAPPQPIGVDEAVPVPGEGRRRRPPRTLGVGRVRLPGWARPRVLLAAAGVVVLGAVAGWASAPGPTARGARPAVAAPATDWRQVLADLDAAWAAGFAHPAAGFAAVDVPDGSAYQADTAAGAALAAHRVHAAGLRLVLVAVAVESRSSQGVTLRVTDQRPAYVLLDSAGKVVQRVAARGTATHHIELRQVGAAGAWRIARVSP
jgi:hypothetical protein